MHLHSLAFQRRNMAVRSPDCPVAAGRPLAFCVQNTARRPPLTRNTEGMFVWVQAYEKGGVTGLFGATQTVFCHHITADCRYAIEAAADRTFATEDEVWLFLGKRCKGRFCFTCSGVLCSALVPGTHDQTCGPTTCLFLKHGLRCPTPGSAFKSDDDEHSREPEASNAEAAAAAGGGGGETDVPSPPPRSPSVSRGWLSGWVTESAPKEPVRSGSGGGDAVSAEIGDSSRPPALSPIEVPGQPAAVALRSMSVAEVIAWVAGAGPHNMDYPPTRWP